jgi:hypothetical protein
VTSEEIGALRPAVDVDGVFVAPIASDKVPSDRSMDDAAALAWLTSQPGGTTAASAAALAREWGWNRMRAGRRLRAWATAGYIGRSGNKITVTQLGIERASVTHAVTNVTGAPEGVTLAVTSDVTQELHTRSSDRRSASRWSATRLCSLVAALALAVVSGVIAVEGLTMVFAGAFWPVVAIGGVLEAGKLAATAWLRENWCAAEGILRAVMLAMVVILMALNGVGVFGFLTRAHLERQLVMEAGAADRAADIEGRLSVEGEVLGDLDRRIKQIDAAIDESTRRGRPAIAMAVGNSLHRTRSQLSLSRQHETIAVAGLQVEKSQIEAQLRRARTEVGPVRYLAELIGGPTVDLERAVRILTLAVVGVLDPMAIALLVAASQPSR